KLPPQPIKPLARTSNGAAATIDRDSVAFEYLQAMRAMVEAQRDVMVRYFGKPATADAAQQVDAQVPQKAPGANVNPEVEIDPPVTNLLDALRAIVSARTGYPVGMLDPELNLESDLGIDSIKRIEILGVLGERLGLTMADPDESDQFVGAM